MVAVLSVAVAVARGRDVTGLPALAARFGGGHALDDAVAGQHAAVDREVATDHEGSHGGILLGQAARLVEVVSLVLAAIDQDEACVAPGLLVAFVRGVDPTPALAKTLKILDVEAVRHLVLFLPCAGMFWNKAVVLRRSSDRSKCRESRSRQAARDDGPGGRLQVANKTAEGQGVSQADREVSVWICSRAQRRW